ncbi:hypothetical protein ACE6HX_09190 [Bacillus pumilus]|uniref:hypothetical protein n=1 Tax=Bacillus pumilus TaxID=1408 RepID=UPI0035D0B6D8
MSSFQMKQFLLHDDFYGEDGQAFQSEDDVIVTKEDKAPTLQDVRQDLASLLDFSITRWFLEGDVIDALKQHDEKKILDSVQSLFDETQHVEVKSRMIEKLKSISEKELPTAAFISLISLHSFSRSLGEAGSRKLSSLG